MADDRTTDAAGTQPAQPENGDQPGRPIGPDEIDPELIALPRPRMRIGPLLSLSVVVFCIFIMLRVRPDLRFALQDQTAQEMGSVAALLGTQDLDDRFVRVPAVPDRTLAVHVAASLAKPGSRLTPVQGTDGAFWIMLDGSVWTAGIQYNEVYTGRMRRLADLPFADKLRRHVDGRPPAERFVQPAALRAALEAGAATVEAPAGDAIAVAADTPVHVYQAPGDLVRIMTIPTDGQPTAEAWTEALAAAGLVTPDAKPRAGALESWVFTTSVTGGAEAAQVRLEEAGLMAAGAEPVLVVHEASWSDLAARGQALGVASRQVPWDHIEWVSLTVPRTVPDQAWVLLTEERPQAYWYVPILFALLGLFGLLFSWALVRALRPGAEPDPLPAPASTTTS